MHLFFCDTSSWWFSTKVIIPTLSELENQLVFSFLFFKRNTDRSHAYLHLNFHTYQAKENHL